MDENFDGQLFTTLEEADTALNAEQAEWNRLGLNLTQINLGQISQLFLDLSTKIQALTNVLVLSGLIEEEDLQLQFKTILYNNLVAIRSSVPDKDEAERAEIRGGR